MLLLAHLILALALGPPSAPPPTSSGTTTTDTGLPSDTGAPTDTGAAADTAETGDTSAETGDSGAETGDSGADTGDTASPCDTACTDSACDTSSRCDTAVTPVDSGDTDVGFAVSGLYGQRPGCGCNTPSTAGSGALVGLALLLATLPRRHGRPGRSP